MNRPSRKAALGEEEPLVDILQRPAVKLELKAVQIDRQKSDS